LDFGFGPDGARCRIADRSKTMSKQSCSFISILTPPLIESGVAAEQAGPRARIKFGRADAQKQRYRSAIGLRPFDEIVGDLRYGFRSLFWGTACSR
jgi:hypothetical protein